MPDRPPRRLPLLVLVPALLLAGWWAGRATAPVDPGGAREAAVRRLEARIRALEGDRAARGEGASSADAPGDDASGTGGAAAGAGGVGTGSSFADGPVAGGSPPAPADAGGLARDPGPGAAPTAPPPGLEAEPGSPEHRGAVRRLLDDLVRGGVPPLDEEGIARARSLLEREAVRARLSPSEAEDASRAFTGLPPGHAGRPGLALAVAGGWGRDERLGGFLSGLEASVEPGVHRAVLEILDDEHPGEAFGQYVLRLVREARDPAALEIALDLDIVEAAATAALAPRLAEAIEGRLLDGGWEPDLRSRAGLAISVASLRAPETGIAILLRVADRESDASLAERFRRAAAALRAGRASLKSLEQIFE